MTKEEWNTVYFSTMAMASVAIGALGVTIGLLALKRSTQSETQLAGVAGYELVSGVSVNIPKVHYDDGEVLVEVRRPGEWHNIRDFVQPDAVSRIAEEINNG